MDMPTTSLRKALFVSRERCINCGSADLTTLDNGNFREGIVHTLMMGSPHGEDPLPALSDATWVLQRCGECDQVFHRNVLNPEWMGIAYSRWASVEAMEEYERRFGGDAFGWRYRVATNRIKHVLRLERLTRGLRGKGPVRVLDFGCGRGEFVETCQNNEFEAYGVDFSTSRMASARVKIVPSLDDAPGQFHAAALFEVLEHVERPDEILAMLSSRLVDGGILIVETPDCSGVTGISSAREMQLVDPIQHINGYTPATLTAIVERAGFKRIRRPLAVAGSSPIAIAKNVAAWLLGRGERSTQQYFRKVA